MNAVTYCNCHYASSLVPRLLVGGILVYYQLQSQLTSLTLIFYAKRRDSQWVYHIQSESLTMVELHY